MNKNNKTGFTILELMIAVTILAVILLMVALIMTNIGSLYSKGVELTNVQNVNRSLVSELAATIQFGGQTMEGPNTYTYTSSDGTAIQVSAICFGTTRYSYILGFPGGSSSSSSIPHILWRDEMRGLGSCVPLNIGLNNPVCGSISGPESCIASIPGSGSNMLGDNMHLTVFTVKQYNPQLYGISVGLVYGDKNLFKTTSTGSMVTTKNGNYICSGQTGDAFCATSFLSTLADERVN